MTATLLATVVGVAGALLALGAADAVWSAYEDDDAFYAGLGRGLAAGAAALAVTAAASTVTLRAWTSRGGAPAPGWIWAIAAVAAGFVAATVWTWIGAALGDLAADATLFSCPVPAALAAYGVLWLWADSLTRPFPGSAVPRDPARP